MEYFQGTYSNRPEKWALVFCHFDHRDTDTNNFLESFHNKLKTNPKYLNHHVNRRCDDLIAILLSFEEDMYHDRKYLDIMTSPDSLSLKHDGIDRHKKAIGISDDDIKVKLQLLNRLYHIHVLCLGRE